MQTTKPYGNIIFANETKPLQVLADVLKTDKFKSSRFFILTDSNTNKYCLPVLLATIPMLQLATILEIESGEENKNLGTAEKLWLTLLNKGADRNSLILNLGGGMVSDMGGFVAAAYKRGISYINIPTTLLAMVDAAIGGKAAVDLGYSKNQIGFFHQPLYTCLNAVFLKTLDIRELKAGVAEMYKTALISNVLTWQKMQEKDITETAFDISLIDFCAKQKLEITEKDPFEKGLRKILNFGHSIGHALESASLANDPIPLLHGEAVALGMVAELYLSVLKLNFPEKDFEAVSRKLLDNFKHNPASFQNSEQLIAFLLQDKKNADSKIKMSLLKNIGEPAYNIEITKDEALESFAILIKMMK